MAILVALALFTVILVSIIGFGYVFFVRPKNLLRQLETITSSNLMDDPYPPESASEWTVVSSLQWLGEKMPLSPEESSLTRKELAAAGYRADNAVAEYLSIRVTCVVALTILAFTFRSYVVASNTLGLILVGSTAVLTFFLVGFGLDHVVNGRRERLRLSLPDALDLLVVCVEAGQGIDQAIRVVSRELQQTHRDLSEELALASMEMRAGTTRAEALTHMSERTGEAELRKLVSVLIQTDRFGTSVGEALRTHADYLRVRRQQEAEERAGKVGVKLIIPIFFGIMPSIMIVSAGPGMLLLYRQLDVVMK